MSKKVLILGGTGILGRVLCNYLLNANSGSNKEFLYYPENITVNCDNLRQVFQGELDVMTRDYVRKLLVELI